MTENSRTQNSLYGSLWALSWPATNMGQVDHHQIHKKTEKGATNKIQNTNKQNTIHLHLPDQRDKQMLQINSYHRALEGLSIDVGWLPLVVTSHIYFFAHLLYTQLRITLAPCAVNGWRYNGDGVAALSEGRGLCPSGGIIGQSSVCI